jgi:SAM-dependent methyltransferase
MPSIDENIEEWGSRHDWTRQGADWSDPWGGTDYLWWGTVHPRIMRFLPAAHVLEIAPGYGRLTQFLQPRATRLTIVDLNERCITACRERFAGADNVDYHVNDGRSLAMVPDDSVDFAFSFDSLVHADAGVIEAYLEQLAAKLTPDGIAFLHHSNAGSFALPVRRWAQLVRSPAVGDRVNQRLNRNWRSDDMTAERFNELAAGFGLRCVAQESVNWLSRLPNDCFSTLTRAGSRWDRPTRAVRNLGFMAEMRRLRQTAELYGHGRHETGDGSGPAR